MKTENSYYKTSGKIGVIAFLFIIITGVLASFVLSFLYAYTITYIHFIISYLIPAFCGFFLGEIISRTGILFKSRNLTFMILSGLIFGILTEYLSWVFYIYIKSEYQLLNFEIDNVLNSIKFLAENGTWGIFDLQPTGWILYTLWIIEAFIIILLTTLTIHKKFGSKPFCEDCKKWIKNTIVIPQLEPIENISQFVSALENGNFQELFNLNKIDIKNPKQTQIQLVSCGVCNNKHYLTIKNVSVKIDDKGKIEESKFPIMENLIVNNETLNEIKKWNNSLN